jgi:hypothetical protein
MSHALPAHPTGGVGHGVPDLVVRQLEPEIPQLRCDRLWIETLQDVQGIRHDGRDAGRVADDAICLPEGQ